MDFLVKLQFRGDVLMEQPVIIGGIANALNKKLGKVCRIIIPNGIGNLCDGQICVDQ